MTRFSTTYKSPFFLILIALIVISVMNTLLQLESQHIVYPDSESYFEAAQNVYIYLRGHNYRPIGLAIIQGIPFLFQASNAFVYSFAFWMNLFFWLGTILLLFSILKEYLEQKTAFYLTLAYISCVGVIAYIYHLLSENCYVFCMILAYYWFQKYYKLQQFKYLSYALALVSFSMLIRPGSKLLALIFIGYFVKELIKNYKSKAQFFLYAAALLILIQCVGMKYQFGNFTISYIDSVTYYNYIGSKAVSLNESRSFKDVKNERQNYIFSYTINGNKISEIAKNDLILQLEYNKVNLLKAYFMNVFENSFSGNAILKDCVNVENKNQFEMSKRLFLLISKYQNSIITLFGFVLGVIMLFKSYKKDRFFSCVALFILYTIALSGISSEQGDRFDVVFYPFVLLLVGKFILEVKQISEPLQK